MLPNLCKMQKNPPRRLASERVDPEHPVTSFRNPFLSSSFPGGFPSPPSMGSARPAFQNWETLAQFFPCVLQCFVDVDVRIICILQAFVHGQRSIHCVLQSFPKGQGSIICKLQCPEPFPVFRFGFGRRRTSSLGQSESYVNYMLSSTPESRSHAFYSVS